MGSKWTFTCRANNLHKGGANYGTDPLSTRYRPRLAALSMVGLPSRSRRIEQNLCPPSATVLDLHGDVQGADGAGPDRRPRRVSLDPRRLVLPNADRGDGRDVDSPRAAQITRELRLCEDRLDQRPWGLGRHPRHHQATHPTRLSSAIRVFYLRRTTECVGGGVGLVRDPHPARV